MSWVERVQGEARVLFTLPWREGRLTLSAAKCETGWGDLSTRAPFDGRDCHPAPPLISFASTPQGRVSHAFADAELRTRPNNCACSCRAASTRRFVASSIDVLIRLLNSLRASPGGSGSG